MNALGSRWWAGRLATCATFLPYPLYFEGGRGGHAIDIDGNVYIDYFLGQGPLLLGHNHPEIQTAIEEQRETGSLVLNPTLAVEVAEAIQAVVPCAERVRLLNSGTEAVITALRCARALTGRSNVVKFLGHYHGQDDQMLIGVGRTSEVAGRGVSTSATAQTITARYGDIDDLEWILGTSNDIAAVILDPAMHAGGLWGSTSQYLAAVRDLTRNHDVLLIFDEVITGFRLALGGAQSYYGINPDLATFAKALAAGEKLAAVAGRAEVMDAINPRSRSAKDRAFQSGTGNDVMIPLLSARAALKLYGELDRNGAYADVALRSRRLASGLENSLRARGISAVIHQLGPLLDLRLTDQCSAFEVPSEADVPWVEAVVLALATKGVLLGLPTSGHAYLSFAHADDDIEYTLSAVESVLDAYDFGALVSAGT